ncbi:MAG TPA: hypothetical protein VGO67_05425 [Verrucomicrobiae bacterium]|jgi:hypothetical protein
MKRFTITQIAAALGCSKEAVRARMEGVRPDGVEIVAGIITDIAAKESHHWRNTESGLADFNLQVRHATTPRAKIIECLIRILQERQRSEPGFVGFNERTEKVERMQDFIAKARSGKVHPSEQLLHIKEWAKRLDQIFAEFNADVQNGKMLPGISPAAASP